MKSRFIAHHPWWCLFSLLLAGSLQRKCDFFSADAATFAFRPLLHRGLPPPPAAAPKTSSRERDARGLGGNAAIRHHLRRAHFMIPDVGHDYGLMDESIGGSTLMLGFETFDGSSIVDPVVVSNVFWSSLKAKILSVVVAQLLATIVFGGLAILASSQLSNLRNFLSENVFKEENVAGMANAVVDRTRKPTTTPDFGKLLICVLIDVVGTSSEFVPIMGEISDVVWAPIAATALRSLYGNNLLFVLEFAEEILPLTDILPLATICWGIDTYFGDTGAAQALGLGIYSNRLRSASPLEERRDGVLFDVPESWKEDWEKAQREIEEGG